jgi:hypothetical protein
MWVQPAAETSCTWKIPQKMENVQHDTLLMCWRVLADMYLHCWYIVGYCLLLHYCLSVCAIWHQVTVMKMKLQLSPGLIKHHSVMGYCGQLHASAVLSLYPTDKEKDVPRRSSKERDFCLCRGSNPGRPVCNLVTTLTEMTRLQSWGRTKNHFHICLL